RVVNTADVVPRLPPGVVIELLVDILRFLKNILPALEYLAKLLDDKFSKYRHHGDMRYLTNCKSDDCSDVRLIHNITFLARIRRLIKNRLSLDRHVKDHSISEYRTKLAAYADKRTK
ncbi:MAG: lipase family protein, partial [Thiohalophilus sp.]